jgi:hypothetical protein
MAKLSSPSTSQRSTPSKQDRRPLVAAAAVAGAAAGIALSGPAVGMTAAAAAAYTAANDDGAVGDAARATGETVIELEHAVVEWEEEHHVVERATELAKGKLEEGKEYVKKHSVVEKARQIAIDSYQAVAVFAEKHQLVEKGARAVEKSANFVTLKWRECTSTDTTV